MKKILLLIICSVVLLSCSKKETKCETWEVNDYCIPKQSNVFCSPPVDYEIPVCGDDLNLAHSGKEKIRKDDADARLMRKYIKKTN